MTRRFMLSAMAMTAQAVAWSSAFVVTDLMNDRSIFRRSMGNL